MVGSALARSHASPLTDWPNERLTSAWDWKYSENLTNWRSEWWNLDCTVYSIGVDRIWPEFSVRIMLIQFTLHLWKVYGALAPQYHARGDLMSITWPHLRPRIAGVEGLMRVVAVAFDPVECGGGVGGTMWWWGIADYRRQWRRRSKLDFWVVRGPVTGRI
jgi:hypothetical protein